MLTDLISARAEEAQAILSTPGHANIWPTLEAKTVDQVKLASLAFILKGKPLDDGPVIEYMKTFENLASAGEEGPWLNLLPIDLVEYLARLRDDQIAAVATAWAATEEARLDRWNAKEVESFVRELSAFAGSARAQDRMVMLWACL